MQPCQVVDGVPGVASPRFGTTIRAYSPAMRRGGGLCFTLVALWWRACAGKVFRQQPSAHEIHDILRDLAPIDGMASVLAASSVSPARSLAATRTAPTCL